MTSGGGLPGEVIRPIYTFTAELWESRAPGAWRFVTLPAADSAEITELSAPRRKGFGSVRVLATVGGTRWETSLFPDSGRGAFVLPIKRSVREREGLDVGDELRVTVELREQ